MNDLRNNRLLTPKTGLGKASVLYFCLVWWLLTNQPGLHFFNDMCQGDHVVWLLGMPINFTYIIAVALITVIWTVVVLSKWEVGDNP